jgi:hypothetical protein
VPTDEEEEERLGFLALQAMQEGDCIGKRETADGVCV